MGNTLPLNIRKKLVDYGAIDWLEKLLNWEIRIENSDYITNWYDHDMRTTHNLGSSRWQGLLNDDTPYDLENNILQLEDDIVDWINDHFVGDDGDTVERYHRENLGLPVKEDDIFEMDYGFGYPMRNPYDWGDEENGYGWGYGADNKDHHRKMIYTDYNGIGDGLAQGASDIHGYGYGA